MADQNNKTPEDIEKELSVGKFAEQQGRAMGIQFGSAALGYVAGSAVAGTKLAKGAGNWNWAKGFGGGKKAIALIGGFLGFMVGGLYSGYQHWVKGERERLSVQEINKDVADLMGKRVQFEDTLDSQHTIVKEMLKKYDATGQSLGDKVLAARENSDSVEQSRI